MRGKEKTLLKKGFSPSPAPLSSFLKLLLFQTVFSFPGHTSEVFFNRVPFFKEEEMEGKREQWADKSDYDNMMASRKRVERTIKITDK